MFESDINKNAIAVLLPCYNEGKTIARVVVDFRKALPSARIFVYDNNSSDDTAEQAKLAGATVVASPRQGKGNVVRQMFSDIDADIYLMADGDGTYDHSAAPEMIGALIDNNADMVIGKRRNVTQDAGRRGHAIGNRLFNKIYQLLFGADFTDIFSGYRAFSRRFAKSFPADSHGFEIETEMSVHATQLRLPVVELEFDYGRRVEGSESKLATLRDGWRILFMMAMLMKETRPFVFFSFISFGFLTGSLALLAPVLAEYYVTGVVDHTLTWILAMTLFLASMMSLMTGTILDSLARGRAETKRIYYLSISKRNEANEMRLNGTHNISVVETERISKAVG